MKFMVSWSIDQDKWMPVLQKWGGMTKKDRANAGKGVKIIGRWHDLAGRQGVAIFQAADLARLNHYLGQWNPFMDMDVVPVLDDEESAKVAKGLVADHGG